LCEPVVSHSYGFPRALVHNKIDTTYILSFKK